MPNLDDELKDAPTAGEEAVIDGGVETIARETPYVPTPQNTPHPPLQWKNIRPYAMPALLGVAIGFMATGVTLLGDVLASRYTVGTNILLTREAPGVVTLMATTLIGWASMTKKTDEEKPFGFYLTQLAAQSATMYSALVGAYKVAEIMGAK